MATTGAMVVITESAMRSNTSAKGLALVQGHRCPGIATGGHRGVERDLADQRHTDIGGQAGAPARSEQGVGGAVLADEVAHVLDHAGHPEVALAGHVGRAGRHLLGGHRGSGHHDHLGPGEHAGQAHLDVAGTRRHVDQQVVEVAPVDVLEELLDGTVEDQAAPHDGAVLVGQESHRQHPEDAVTDAPLEGDHLLVPGLDLPLHPEQAGNGEPPDVGVEDAHGQAPAGQGHGQVDGDRALARPRPCPRPRR